MHVATLTPVRKNSFRAALALTVVAGLCFALLELASSRTFQLYGGLVGRVETEEKLVALTFDDGPDATGTPQVLDELRDRDVRATFFLVGRDLEENQDLGRVIAADGHAIGNHTHSHRRMMLVGSDTVASEIERTDDLIRQTGYEGEITFRPPYGKKLVALPRYLDQHQRRTIMWDVEPDSDPDGDADVDRIVEDTVENVRPGSIILLHPHYGGGVSSRAAIGPIIDRLQDDGYRFVTVPELLESGT